jgi:hypothetical protein
MQCQKIMAAMRTSTTTVVTLLALVSTSVRRRWQMVWLHKNKVPGSAALIVKFAPATAGVCSRSTTSRRFALGLGGRRGESRSRKGTVAMNHWLSWEQRSGLILFLWLRTRTGRYLSTSTLMATLAMSSCRTFPLLLCMMSIVICSWHQIPTSPRSCRRTCHSQLLLCNIAVWTEQQSQ